MVARLFHADTWLDRQTNMMNLIAPFRSFANVPKNCISIVTLSECDITCILYVVTLNLPPVVCTSVMISSF